MLGAEPASAGRFVHRAVTALRSNPIYVDPSAEYKPDPADVRELRRRIAGSHAGPMFVADLPARAAAEAGGDPSALAAALRRRLGRPGTYAVAVGADFRATSSELPPGTAARLAAAAYAAHRDDGVGPTLLDFASRVDAAKSGRSEGGGAWKWIVAAIVAVLVAGVALVALARWHRRTAPLRPVRRAARDDLAAFAAEARDLEPAAAHPAAAEPYRAALDAYARAEQACDRARSPEDLRAVAATLAQGRFELARARAQLEGGEPPPSRRPCFFDARHGPGVREVDWDSRRVAACKPDAERIEQGADPEVRHVLVAGRAVPYWEAPAEFRPWLEGQCG